MKEFVLAVQEEEETEFYGGVMKAPKVLADIVESIAAAVYVDCGFDLKELWLVRFFDFFSSTISSNCCVFYSISKLIVKGLSL